LVFYTSNLKFNIEKQMILSIFKTESIEPERKELPNDFSEKNTDPDSIRDNDDHKEITSDEDMYPHFKRCIAILMSNDESNLQFQEIII
jgi:hypothetical protein